MSTGFQKIPLMTDFDAGVLLRVLHVIVSIKRRISLSKMSAPIRTICIINSLTTEPSSPKSRVINNKSRPLDEPLPNPIKHEIIEHEASKELDDAHELN